VGVASKAFLRLIFLLSVPNILSQNANSGRISALNEEETPP
jgi:hypothetical protein